MLKRHQQLLEVFGNVRSSLESGLHKEPALRTLEIDNYMYVC